MRTRVGIVFGGKSGEHEVSLQSAKSIYEALDKEKYEPVLLGIDKQGAWHLGVNASFFLNASDPKLIALNAAAPVVVPGEEKSGTGLVLKDTESGIIRGGVDVFFPIVHGTFGEDGSLQGFFRLLDVPFVGASVLGSAVGMDKDVMKRLLRAAGLPTARFGVLRSAEGDLTAITRELGLPVFVKPANLGSSVGISKVKRADDLKHAVLHALKFDRKVLVEEAIPGREIEVAVLGNNDNPEASVCGEIIPQHEFYSYDAKYIDENGAKLRVPAPLDPEISDRIRGMALQVFKVLDCEGMGRVDFFLPPDLNPVVNEINTLPGFTRISMYPKLWEATGLTYAQLLDRLIDLAIERHRRESLLRRTVE